MKRGIAAISAYISRSFVAKAFIVCFAGTHIPLIALCVYLFQNRDNWMAIFMVALLATLAGTVLSLYFMFRLIEPLHRVVETLNLYRDDQIVSRLDLKRSDEVGRVAEGVDDLIEKTEIMIGQLRQQAYTDQLTSLGNRRWMIEIAGRTLAKAKRDGEIVSIIAIDLDHFKGINDQYGHSAGDAVLAATAHCIQNQIRPYDIVARMGGEEFCALLPGVDAAGALQVAERLRKAVSEMTVEPLPEGKLTISIGIYSAAAGLESLASMLHEADLRLYQAKHRGRNTIVNAPLTERSSTNV